MGMEKAEFMQEAGLKNDEKLLSPEAAETEAALFVALKEEMEKQQWRDIPESEYDAISSKLDDLLAQAESVTSQDQAAKVAAKIAACIGAIPVLAASVFLQFGGALSSVTDSSDSRRLAYHESRVDAEKRGWTEPLWDAYGRVFNLAKTAKERLSKLREDVVAKQL